MLKKWLFAFCLCLLMTFSASAQDSPLFLYGKPVGMYGGQWPIDGLFVYDEVTGESHDLINNPDFHVQDAAWSPDGKQIALAGTEFREGPIHLYLMNADGSNLQRINDLFLYNFAWSPDGQKLAFTAVDADGGLDLYLYYPEDARTQNLTQGTDAPFSHPSWSPDSQRIAFSSITEPAGIHIINLDGETHAIPIDLVTVLPVWSPDGSSIAYSAQVVNEPGVDLYVVDLQSGEQRQLTQSIPNGHRPTWSPDGRQLAFIGWDEWPQSQLYVMNMPDGEPYTPLDSLPGDGSLPNTVNTPDWSPDGRSISFVYLSGDESGIYAAREGAVELLVLGGGLYPYGWQPASD